MHEHIPYRSYVELASPDGVLWLPEGVGRLRTLPNGLRGTVTSTGYGTTCYVRWADGNEGPCPVRWLEVVRVS